ncbi:MAG: hypothetical protein QM784_08185 [Polyangiaceae bacterium]
MVPISSIDPEPPLKVIKATTQTPKPMAWTERSGRDDVLLQQRKEFLRPDSLLAIVMLTDENDCSIKDSGPAWLMAGSKDNIKVAAQICETNPNDPCCYSCNMDPPEGCAKDPTCETRAYDDKSNLRCFDQKRRFGYDFLFPTARYVNALKLKTICPYQNFGDLDCECTGHDKSCTPGPSFPNPLYTADAEQLAAGITPRTEANMIFLAGIVGVPWQDIATSESLNRGKEYLKYLPASEIRWDYLLPDANGNPPVDPLMRESMTARSGIHPVTQEPIGGPTGTNRLNQINGHEWDPDNDLQFACTFDLTQLAATKDCAKEASNTCSCSTTSAPAGSMSPLCQNPTDGSYGTTQYAAKAYPGTRQLEVLRAYNDTVKNNSIVASICPRTSTQINRIRPVMVTTRQSRR